MNDAYAGEAVRDRLEDIEICSINVELLNRTGSFDDPAWIERRSLAARTRLEATTDPLLLPGYRKLVRKWNEEIMRFQRKSATPETRDDHAAYTRVPLRAVSRCNGFFGVWSQLTARNCA
jgi:hypothetical protein